MDKVIVKSFNTEIGKIRKVELLGIGKVKFKQTNEGLIVTIPKGFSATNGFVIKAKL